MRGRNPRARRTEATDLGTAVMFAGVLLTPPVFGAVVTTSCGYAIAYTTLALLAVGSAMLLSLASCGRRIAKP